MINWHQLPGGIIFLKLYCIPFLKHCMSVWLSDQREQTIKYRVNIHYFIIIEIPTHYIQKSKYNNKYTIQMYNNLNSSCYILQQFITIIKYSAFPGPDLLFLFFVLPLCFSFFNLLFSSFLLV